MASDNRLAFMISPFVDWTPGLPTRRSYNRPALHRFTGLVWISNAEAHGFGERYELPLPLALFLSASGLVVLVSFVVLVIFFRQGADLRSYPRLELPSTGTRPLVLVLRLVALFFYLLVIIAGLFGSERAFKNIAPVMIWAVCWVGFAYAAALIGNVWALINPMDTLFRWLGGERFSRRLPYPPAFGQWPAVALFLAFAWLELISESADTPATLAKLLLAYSALTWSGMFLFGREEWLRRGELLNVIYDYLSRFAPFEYRVVERKRQWNLRPYAVGLLQHVPLTASEIVLVVLILSAV